MSPCCLIESSSTRSGTGSTDKSKGSRSRRRSIPQIESIEDANANILLNLGADDKPGLWLYDKDRLRAALTVRGDRMLMEMFDMENHPRPVLGVYREGILGGELYDQHEKLRTAFGRAGLDLTRATVGEQPLVAPLSLFDADGHVIWRAP